MKEWELEHFEEISGWTIDYVSDTITFTYIEDGKSLKKIFENYCESK